MTRLLAIAALVLLLGCAAAVLHSTEAVVGAAAGVVLATIPGGLTLWAMRTGLAGPNAVLLASTGRMFLIGGAALVVFLALPRADHKPVLLAMLATAMIMLAVDSVILARAAHERAADGSATSDGPAGSSAASSAATTVDKAN